LIFRCRDTHAQAEAQREQERAAARERARQLRADLDAPDSDGEEEPWARKPIAARSAFSFGCAELQQSLIMMQKSLLMDPYTCSDATVTSLMLHGDFNEPTSCSPDVSPLMRWLWFLNTALLPAVPQPQGGGAAAQEGT
jgi:hypothetical protein